MTFAERVIVHSAGSKPFCVLAAIRDMLHLSNVLEVQRQLASGPINLGEWDYRQAKSVAEELRALGASVTTERGAVLSYYGNQYVEYLKSIAEPGAAADGEGMQAFAGS